MELRFITATYNNGVYRIADFYAGAVYVAGTVVYYNFTADNGLSSLVVNNDDMDYSTKTHMIVPDLERVYEISAYEYVNSDQTRLILTEDPLIANWLNFQSTPLFLTRTNNIASFAGIHDIENVALNYTTTLTTGMECKTGRWVLITYQPDGAPMTISFDTLTTVGNSFELFANLAAVIAKYPETATTNPNSFYYMDHVVFDAGAGVYRQCTYDGANLRWTPFVDMTGLTTFTITTYINTMSSGDIPVHHALIPMSSFIQTNIGGGWRKVPSFYNLVSPIDPRVLSIRVVDENLLPNFTTTYAAGIWQTVTSFTAPSSGAYSLTMMDCFQEDQAISFTAGTITDIYDYEPFTEYTLSVYGNRFKINRKLIDSNLRFRYQYSTMNLNYIVYYGHAGNVLIQGEVNSFGITASDKFAEFLLQNSTYMQTKMINNIGNFMSRTVMGGISGAMAGGMVGAVPGIISGLVSSGLQVINQNLSEKAMKDAPDTIRGQNNDLSGLSNALFGIYMIKRVPDTIYTDIMKMNYLFRGHPTNVRTTVAALVATTHPVVPAISFKLIYGEFKGVIKNQFVSGVINERLNSGVIFVV